MPRRPVKIVVLGPGEAGKSTLIEALCSNAVNLAVNGRTVALDHGTTQYNGRVFHFVGVPGQERFAVVQETLLSGCDAAIVVVPEGSPLDAVTRSLCEQLSRDGVPLIRVWNRFDGSTPGAVPVGDDSFFQANLFLRLEQREGATQLLPVLEKVLRKENEA